MDCLNMLQGFFIFLVLICKRSVLRKIRLQHPTFANVVSKILKYNNNHSTTDAADLVEDHLDHLVPLNNLAEPLFEHEVIENVEIAGNDDEA